ncbi:peptidylprolyl isomerase [Candidatus Neomarinimicrobiota bacterium]
MKKRVLLYILTGFWSLLVVTCSNAPREEVVKTYPDGMKQEVERYLGRGNDRQLLAKLGYYQDGSVSFEENYSSAGGIETYRSWWQNGNPKIIRQYEADSLISETSYDSDGVRHLVADEVNRIIADLAAYQGDPATPQDTVVMETSVGTIKLVLFTDVAPRHCDNFKRLANSGYYDNTTFHRVAPGFVIQGGDILSRDATRRNDGTGGPGFTVPAEFNPRPHRKGTLAMARGTDPNSAGSQFYIALSRLSRLDNNYTVFGEVVEGLEVVDGIATTITDSGENPIYPQRILRVRVD